MEIIWKHFYEEFHSSNTMIILNVTRDMELFLEELLNRLLIRSFLLISLFIWYVAGWMIITNSSFLSCSSFIYKGIVQCFFSIGKYTIMFDVIISNEPKGTWKKQYQVIISTTTNEWNLDAVTYDENDLSNLYWLHIIISIKLHRERFKWMKL